MKKQEILTSALCSIVLLAVPLISWAKKTIDEPVVIPVGGGLIAGFSSMDELKTYILIPIVSFMAREVYQYWKDSKDKTADKVLNLERNQTSTNSKLDHLIDLLERQDREYDRRFMHIESRL